jgi:hypothetical protein
MLISGSRPLKVGVVLSMPSMSATLENEADPTLENEATGSLVSSLSCLGF